MSLVRVQSGVPYGHKDLSGFSNRFKKSSNHLVSSAATLRPFFSLLYLFYPLPSRPKTWGAARSAAWLEEMEGRLEVSESRR